MQYDLATNKQSLMNQTGLTWIQLYLSQEQARTQSL